MFRMPRAAACSVRGVGVQGTADAAEARPQEDAGCGGIGEARRGSFLRRATIAAPTTPRAPFPAQSACPRADPQRVLVCSDQLSITCAYPWPPRTEEDGPEGRLRIVFIEKPSLLARAPVEAQGAGDPDGRERACRLNERDQAIVGAGRCRSVPPEAACRPVSSRKWSKFVPSSRAARNLQAPSCPRPSGNPQIWNEFLSAYRIRLPTLMPIHKGNDLHYLAASGFNCLYSLEDRPRRDRIMSCDHLLPEGSHPSLVPSPCRLASFRIEGPGYPCPQVAD